MPDGRIRGWIGEQSFELAEGHEKYIRDLVETQLFCGTYRAHIQNGDSSTHARVCAKEAVKAFREMQS